MRSGASGALPRYDWQLNHLSIEFAMTYRAQTLRAMTITAASFLVGFPGMIAAYYWFV